MVAAWRSRSRLVLAGAQGPIGPAGPAGPTGETGATGPAGPQGEQGIQGVPGRPGPQGRTGNPGAPGRNGQDGRNGTDGVDGRDGVDGKDGIDGRSLTEAQLLDLQKSYEESLAANRATNSASTNALLGADGFGVGLGISDDEHAISLGASRSYGNTTYRGNITYDSQGNTTLGVGFKWRF